MATINNINNAVLTSDFTVDSGNFLLPTTSSTVGQIQINAVNVYHSFGTASIYCGQAAGNFTMTTANTINNTAFGYYSMNALVGVNTTNDRRNTAIGYNTIRYNVGYNSTNSGSGQVALGAESIAYNWGTPAEQRLNTGIGDFATYGCQSSNVAIGFEALKGASNYNIANNVMIGFQSGKAAAGNTGTCAFIGYLTATGMIQRPVSATTIGSRATCAALDFCTLIGYKAGIARAGTEVSNICIGYDTEGTNGEANVLRIGNGTGTSAGNINTVFIQGIYGYAGTLGSTNSGVIIDSTGQMQTLYATSSNTSAKTYSFLKANGTGVITLGDTLGTVAWSGHNGTALTVGATIVSTNTGSTVANTAANLTFATKPDSATALTTRLTIAETGCITIAAPDSGTGLTIGSGLTVSAGDTTVGTLLVTTVDTNVAAAGVTLAGTTLAADGTDTDINITITPKGTGTIVSTAVYDKAVGATNRAMLVDDSGLIGNATSSRKFKENIADMSDASSFLMDLRPVVFNYKSDPTKKIKTGLIAEEVAEIAPWLVSYDEDGEPYTVSYHELPALLLNEIKRKIKRIYELEARLDAKEIQ